MQLITLLDQILTLEEKNKLIDSIQIVTLKTGEKILREGDLPRGFYIVKEGRLRLLGKDNDDEPVTIQNYYPESVAGITEICRGINSNSLTAAAETKCEYFQFSPDSSKILSKVITYLNNEFIEAWEIIEVLSHNTAFLDILKNNDSMSIQNKILAMIDTNQISIADCIGIEPNKWYIVSSVNCENYRVGEFVNNEKPIVKIGNLPVRLISIIKQNDQNSFTKFLESSFESKSTKLVKNELVDNTLQIEAMEDWYGKIRDEGIYPHIQGKGLVQESLACLRMLARFFDLPFRKDVILKILKSQFQASNNELISHQAYAAILDMMGLRSIELLPDSPDLFLRIPFPAMAFINSRPMILWATDKRNLTVSDPMEGQKDIPVENILEMVDDPYIRILCVEKSNSTPKKRFGLSWFLPAIQKHKAPLIQVVITSFFVQLLGVFNPLLIQQIIDAVISQGNYKSLNVLGTLLIAMAIAQALLGALRTYLFSDTTNRIDISLGASIINHMFRLPLGYFARRPVGEISSRIAELEKIRGFLTGTALTVFLDVVFSFVYIAVMLLYSVPLTIAALAVVPLFALLTAVVAPIIRKQIRERAEANAKVQSHLVESLTGIETVKGQGMELPSVWRWEQLYDNQIVAGFKNTITSTAAGSTNQFLGQLSGLVILWFGASLVLDGKLTLGQLIAFRILSGYVTTPILRLSSLWQNFQETALSLERLGDIVDHPEEIEIMGENLPPMPSINGKISYEKLSFRFGNKGALQLANINFSVDAGQFIGIVGSSGSGKSTMLKLLTRLYEPVEGLIKIDDLDISKVDLYSLRNQIGVVPQDSLLFDGSVQANISLTKPEATFENVIDAAKIACADEFIQSLPSGYASSVGERGSALSGGQRQRIAIARMVLKEPSLLILDEATSALDVDTEKRLIKNITELYQNKTVLYITHRITSMVHADKILVLHQGNLVEEGTHEQLLALEGRYSTLYKQQEAN